MSKPLRLAFARINQETNALSPVLTTMADFMSVHYIDDDTELLRRCRFLQHEVDSMFRNAELSGFVQGLEKHAKRRRITVRAVPLISAWAVPAGPLTSSCFDALTDALCDKLRAALREGPLDGVYLSLHGAMNVDGFDNGPTETPESEIVRRVRAVVGDVVPVAVSLDLHGLVTSGLVEQSTILQGYQTNPHRDHAAIGARCARLLIDTALNLIAPKIIWRSLPMILGGGNTVDFLPPSRALWRQMKALDSEAGILGVTLMTVHPWNRHRELGWSVLVVVDAKIAGAVERGERAADQLAEGCWAVRKHLPPPMGSPEAAIARARRRTIARRIGVVMMSDASDVVSAGAPGENTALLSALIDAPDLVSYATIRAPDVVDDLHDRHAVGDRVDVELGGKLDPTRGAPLKVTATIERLARGHGVGRFVVLAVASMKLVVVEGPAMAVKPSYFKDAGLDPWKADVVVVKNFFPFLLFFAPLMRDVIFVKTSGVTDFDASFDLDFADPVSPRDVVDDWRGTDARRRALVRAATAATTASLPTVSTSM